MARPARPVDHRAVFAAVPTPCLVLDRDLVVVDANHAYLAMTGRTLEALAGRHVLDVFSPAAGPGGLDGARLIREPLARARDTGRPDTLPVFRYDICDRDGGDWVVRWWSAVAVPVLDAQGRTELVVQRVEDVTDYLREREATPRPDARDERWRSRVEKIEADLFARGEELRAALAAEAATARRLQGLAELALQLSDAETVRDLATALVERAQAALGCFGGAVGVVDERAGTVRATVAGALGPRTEPLFGSIALHGPLPLSVVSATGRRMLMGNLSEALA